MFDIIAATSASEQERRFRDAAKEEMNRVDEMEGVDQLVVTPPPKIISYYNSKMHS